MLKPPSSKFFCQITHWSSSFISPFESFPSFRFEKSPPLKQPWNDVNSHQVDFPFKTAIQLPKRAWYFPMFSRYHPCSFTTSQEWCLNGISRIHARNSWCCTSQNAPTWFLCALVLGGFFSGSTKLSGVTMERSWESFMNVVHKLTKNNAKGKEQRILRNFLRQDFGVQPNEKMQKCHGCQQPFMHFLLLPMRPHNMNKYDPDEHALFCYNCCTEVSQMLSPNHWLLNHPAQQATERLKALTQHPPGLTMEECEVRALSGDRGYIPPTWYLATPPIKLPLTKQGEDEEASQYSLHEWHQLTQLVWKVKKEHAQQGLQTNRSTTYKNLRESIMQADTTRNEEEGEPSAARPPGIPCHISRRRPMDSRTHPITKHRESLDLFLLGDVFYWFYPGKSTLNHQIWGIRSTFSKRLKQIQERVGWLFGLA